MKVLVTGGAGYIGSTTATKLLAAGHEVCIVDNLSTGFREAVPAKASFIFGDIRDHDLMARVMKDQRVEAVVHFAAKLVVPESMVKPFEYYETNVLGGIQLLKACRIHGVKTFIFSSTAAVYGNSERPLLDESAPTAPINPYGASKLMMEQVLRDVGNAESSFRWVALRYFNVAGAALDGSNGQRTKEATHLVKVAAEAAVGKRAKLSIFGTDYPTADGTCVRDYIHVEDLANAHVLALDRLVAGDEGGVFNCGYGRGASVREVIDTMMTTTGRRFEVEMAGRRAGDPAALIADSTKLRTRFGWHPRHDDLALICRTAYEWEKSL